MVDNKEEEEVMASSKEDINPALMGENLTKRHQKVLFFLSFLYPSQCIQLESMTYMTHLIAFLLTTYSKESDELLR